MSGVRLSFFVILLALLVASCSGSDSPQMIASYPKGQFESPPPPPEDLVVTYRAYMELQVSDVDQAAERATGYAYDNGGYLVSSQSWYHEGRKLTTLQLAIPTANFENLRRSLLGLGDLVSEQVSGDLETTGYGDYRTDFSQVSVQFRPTSPAWPALPSLDFHGWNPARTFSRAFEVFVSIFGFLVDILIWMVVVAGPFLLLGWGLFAVIRRLRRQATRDKEQEPNDE